MPDERWKPLIGTPSKPPIPSNILVPDPSPARSLISDAESPTLLPPSPEASFVHRRRQGQYVPRPPVWKIYDYEEACADTYDAGEVTSSLQEKSTHYNWPLRLPGIDQGQLMADVFNSQPLIVNMMTGYRTEPFPEYHDTMAPIAASQDNPGVMQSNSLSKFEQKHKKSHDKKMTEKKRDTDGVSVYSARNTATVSTRSASTRDISEEALDRLHATIFTNPDPFAPKPQRPERTYSPEVSPKTKDPLRMYPGDEAQVVDIYDVPPPRIQDHPSLMSRSKSVAASGLTNHEAVIPPSSPEGQTKPFAQIPSRNALSGRVARFFAARPSIALSNRGALRAPVEVDEGATGANRSGKCAADHETLVQDSKSRTTAQPRKKTRAKDRKRTTLSRSVQLPTVTIPLQTVPLKIHVHVSDVPESQYLEAKIISAQPYHLPTEEQSTSSDLARLESLMQTREGLQSTLESLNGETTSREQTARFDGPDGKVPQGTQDATPIEMSGALGLVLNSRTAQESRRPRASMLQSFKKSIGRSFKPGKLFSRHSDSVTSGKPENVASSEDDHERTLSALRGAIPRLSSSEAEPANSPPIRGPPRTPEPRSDPIPTSGSPANQAAIQSNAIMIATQSPSFSVNRWVQSQGSAQLRGEEDSGSQSMSRRAGNAERVNQPHQVVQPATREDSVPGNSYQHPDSTSNNDGTPAGGWAFGITSNPSSTQDHQPSQESEPPRDRNFAGSLGSDSIPAPPPVTRSMPIRLKKVAKENEGYGYTGFGGTAPSA